MRLRAVVLSLVVAATLLGSAAPAHADWVWRPRYFDPYSRRHIYLGVSGVGAFPVAQSGGTDYVGNGGGFSLFLGARIHRHFALELAWQPTFHNTDPNASQYLFGGPNHTLGIEAFTLDGKIYLANGPVQPYFMFGAGAYVMGDGFGVLADGGGFQLGGGVDFWFNPRLSLGLKVQYRGIYFTGYDPQGYPNGADSYLSMITAALDLTAHF